MFSANRSPNFSLLETYLEDGLAGVNLGKSDVFLMLYRTSEGSHPLPELQQSDVPGEGEDTELFTIDDPTSLTATIHSGSDPSYNTDPWSCIIKWDHWELQQVHVYFEIETLEDTHRIGHFGVIIESPYYRYSYRDSAQPWLFRTQDPLT